MRPDKATWPRLAKLAACGLGEVGDEARLLGLSPSVQVNARRDGGVGQ